ncbi:MAG: glycerol-3-phosphate 1-O-acyltransferase PlsY [Corallococcus sp.]|nr:glycerol-3-phosphate 1-O-acyltransferase PlsY [Corallococcus sp.]
MFDTLVKFWWQFLILTAISYLFGAVNYSIIFSRLVKKQDIRNSGSGNAGTTNMFRVYGLPLGICTFVCDALKGVIVCLATKYIFLTFADGVVAEIASYWGGLFAVVGHVFPPFYGFKGGKGVATTIGVMFSTQPVVIACLVIPIVAVILITDRMSVAALFMVCALTVWQWIAFAIWSEPQISVCIVVTVICATVVFAHRHNIDRLIRRQELPTGLRKVLFKRRHKNDSDVYK